MVHHVLEGRGGVTETKVHDHGFVQAILCFECCLVLISILDTHFIESSFNVEFSEDERILYFCDQFRNEGKWISIADCPLVDASIVLHQSLRSVRLSEEKEG